ncbi:MAG: ABC transporter ATP-binding protein [Clostridiaceae bacterium]|jgi:iron complex transport system ATP-binding protein|nr:ABC transporter ATP-binding protein [Clostridiaceae bacterium]
MTLQVTNGTFGYGKKPIFRNIDLCVNGNTILTVLGPNGVGKTTLLKCIMGFLHWKEGETLLDGKPLHTYSNKEVWQKISYVPQAKKNVFSYTVQDMVVMGLSAAQNFFEMPKKKEYDKAYQMLETVGISMLADKYCNELSGGELQMVMIARALVSKPELLILDEPESGLDMKNQIRILDIIKQASRKMNTACIINTHFPNHALNISDKTLLLGYDNQRLLGNTNELLTEKNIEEFFSVRSRIISFTAGEHDYKTIFPYMIAAGQ